MRVGLGSDVHSFAPGRLLVLGGVEIPHEFGLLGHSDADVLTHSLMDALLGALALGDIGRHFPDTDERYRGISSLSLLREVEIMLRRERYKVANIDCVIFAQKPRLAPYLPEMCANIAAVLALSPSQVSLKATTTEGLGFCGRSEGIAAQSIVLLLSEAAV
jgi:2-C-methyl-D-erythritol 2,4-cyclodiphosphate synthase